MDNKPAFLEMKKNNIEILAYQSQYRQYFIDYNLAWLEEFFYVEDYDKEVLTNCEEHIIKKGGHIFFLKANDEIVGCYALMPSPQNENGVEFTKMAIAKEHRGKGYGKHLMEHAIQFVTINHLQPFVLYSNTDLQNAIHIYKKYGFQEVEIEEGCNYERCNIKMVYQA